MENLSWPIPEFENDDEYYTGQGQGRSKHAALYQFSIEHPDKFWGRLAQSRLKWHRAFDSVLDCDNMASGKMKWFNGGKLNVAENCVDRHYEVNPERVALIWERDEPGTTQHVTYRQLYEMTNRLANTLKSHGVQRSDRVVIYLPTSPIAVAAMLACARIGAIHSVVFAGFSAVSLASRIQDSTAETVITADQAVRGGKTIELKQLVNEAIRQCPTVKRVFTTRLTGAAAMESSPFDISLDEEMMRQSTECSPESMDSEDILFIIYTSGSTGKPKGIAHTQAGFLLQAAVSLELAFEYQAGDVFGCVGDVGWITGHSYVVYGPLCNGATTLLFESTPLYPNPGRYWEMIERLRINQFYCAPTALRLLMRHDQSYVDKYDLSSLKSLASVGEPLNREAWLWFHEVVGKQRCPVVDTWWQSETGAIMISPRPSDNNAEILPAMPMRPFFGIDVALVDQNGQEIDGDDAYGMLCIKKPWPAMARTIYTDHDRYLKTYFAGTKHGYYVSGDGAHRIAGKYYRITGRMDDVINTSGHRIGTAEIEDALDQHPLVSESAVVGFPHDIKGEAIYAFVTLKEVVDQSDDEISKALKLTVRQQIAAHAVPDVIQMVPSLPKNRFGKILRRILRKIVTEQYDDIGDTSTLADPSVVERIISDFIQCRKNH